jgi:molecular chaperone HtpG
MARKEGNIGIHTENIMPIIKKWLYSDKDIFIRELVSNSNDALTKFKSLVSMGEVKVEEDEKYMIQVIINKKEKTIKVIDNGIGMTEEEVEKYITEIAFSGAEDFLEKYKDKKDDKEQIIGHFGLGFYSAFMVSEQVTIDTLSWQKGAKPVRWISTGNNKYEIDDSDQEVRGTVITLRIMDDEKEFLDIYKIKEILMRYCSFLPFEIYLEDVDEEAKRIKEEAKKKKDYEKKLKEAEKKKAEKKDKKEDGEDKEEDEEKIEPYVPYVAQPINDTHPLWLKNPKDCTDEEYKKFYTKVFTDFNEPLFWIHLNVEYPIKLKGILYFPKMKHEFETIEGKVKLFYNQVFVADNIKEVIPEFLLLLKGVIDCPDLPLNVSRSFLQHDKYVQKISSHITKKVSDKLKQLFNKDRDSYNKYWDDINPFVKYGCIREEKFYDRVKDFLIYKTTENEYKTLDEYLKKAEDKHKNKVFYVTDEKQQSQYIKILKDNGMEAVMFNTLIDSHFIQHLEMKKTDVRFSRVDADLNEILKDSDAEVDEEKQKEIKEKLEKVFKKATGNEELKINAENLKTEETPAMIILPEYSRRMQEMSKQYGMMGMAPGMMPSDETLVLNLNNKLIKNVLELEGKEDKEEDVNMICHHIYDLALISHKQLEPEAMTKFIERSQKLLSVLSDLEK